MAALKKDFPSLGEGGASLQKWWTLNLARLAASDRYRGLSLAETDKQLAALLEIELPIDKAGTKKKFPIADFAQYIKLPAARAALASAAQAILALGAQANALLRPVIAEYDGSPRAPRPRQDAESFRADREHRGLSRGRPAAAWIKSPTT